MTPISGVQGFDTIGWATGGSDDPNPHLYIFYKDPIANSIRILESNDLPDYGVWTTWRHSQDVITPSATIRFSDNALIAAASTYGLGFSGNKKIIRVFVYCEDRRIRDYVWYPGSGGWQEGDLQHDAIIRAGRKKFAAQAYEYGGAACFSIFYQDNDGWVHEGRKCGEDEWHFQTVGEMLGDNPGLLITIWNQNGVLNKRIIAQNLAIDAQLRDYTYEPTLHIWNPADEYKAGIASATPSTLNSDVTFAGHIFHNNPHHQGIYFNCGDHLIREFARQNMIWRDNNHPVAFDAKPYAPFSLVYMLKTIGPNLWQWTNAVYINDAGNLAQSEYRYCPTGWQWLKGGVIQV